MFYQPVLTKALFSGMINHHELAVLATILSFMNEVKGSFPSNQTMSTALKLHERSIRRYAQSLVLKELLESFPRKRHSTTYRLGRLSRQWLEDYKDGQKSKK
jgi:DNA-binding IclR family transcriptional regulator